MRFFLIVEALVEGQTSQFGGIPIEVEGLLVVGTLDDG
jgi:hypothetical protein